MNIFSGINQTTSFKTTDENCLHLQFTAVYMTALMLASLFFNLTLLVVICRYKQLQTSYNMFIVCLVLINLFGTVTELPIGIINHFNCGYKNFKYIYYIIY